MIIEFEVNGARVIVSGENLTVNVTEVERASLHVPGPTAKTLNEWLKGSGLTQEKFAEIIGVHRVHLSRFINGRLRPNWKMIAKIKRATGGEVNFNSWLAEVDQ
jgi:plasmid maintenance system antidote protein VapI